MDTHRRIDALSPPQLVQLDRPFSSFDFIESQFAHENSIRRIFSLARSFDAKTLILEEIPPTGIIEDENKEILELSPACKTGKLFRASFWQKKIVSISSITNIDSIALAGYAIFKEDILPNRKKWHVFEAVFRKYPHDHNCVPKPKQVTVKIGPREFSIGNVLYCQQNDINKSCAQVALRSVLLKNIDAPDISYRKLNDLAREAVVEGETWSPKGGLGVIQMRHILDHFNLNYLDIDYDQSPEYREALPYQKIIYGGIESGAGALLGFKLAGSQAVDAKHIIPFFGHTFNKDTWAPDAEINYFKVGDSLSYIPSESWTSSFIGHDDNFGPNFCVPRLYIDKENVDYVVEIFPKGKKASAVMVEVAGVGILFDAIPTLVQHENKWLRRLISWTKCQQVVYRTVAVSKEEYIAWLSAARDWDGNVEDVELVQELSDNLPESLWVVEISTPQLYPANEHKLGEIVFDGADFDASNLKLDDVSKSVGIDAFVFGRVPGLYLFAGETQADNNLEFLTVPSTLGTHTNLIRL